LTIRLTPKLDNWQPIEQAGFRKGYSTIYQIHGMEKRKEFQRPLIMTFIDFKKAFDFERLMRKILILKRSIVEAMKRIGIEKP